MIKRALEVTSVSFDSNKVALVSAFPSLSPLGITKELIIIVFHAFLDGLCSKSVLVRLKNGDYEIFSIELLRSSISAQPVYTCASAAVVMFVEWWIVYCVYGMVDSCVCGYLCLGGRSHEAYCNHVVCCSVCLLHHFCGAR